MFTFMCRYMQSAAFPGHEKDVRQQRLAAAKAKRQVWCCWLLHTCCSRDPSAARFSGLFRRQGQPLLPAHLMIACVAISATFCCMSAVQP